MGARSTSTISQRVGALRSELPGHIRELALRFGAFNRAPGTTYYLLLTATGILVLLGLIMVFSSSTANSINQGQGPIASVFKKQALYALVGLIGGALASRMTIDFWRRITPWVVIAAFLGQVLVFTPLGATFQGNRNWLSFGGISVQPSEFVKLALVLSGALILTHKRAKLGQLKEVVVPFLAPIALFYFLLVMLGRDLGTALVMGAIIVALLFASGVRMKWFAWAMAGAAAMVFVAVRVSGDRMARISIWLDPDRCQDPKLLYGICRQPMHGLWALADGGIFGVGLGASREKWGWLSEPSNDFLFAIIGEELGLVGSLAVLALFACLFWGAYRLAVRSRDPFVQLASVGIGAGLIAQALINIGSVSGVLPVIGVPLPFVSAGGSSMIASMVAMGILLSFARNEPGAQAVLGQSRLRQRLANSPIARRFVR